MRRFIVGFYLQFVCFFLLSMGCWGNLRANAFDYLVKHFTVRQGLLSNKGITVCRDGKGYHWVGSEKGLQRFDG